ncbi:MAG: DUF5132 domain-containing protein [Syntrophorhabdales bacterium]|jgi:hypothetical protein
MSFVEDMFKGNLGTGLAIGLGTLILGPVIIPVIGGIVKPVAKAAIKGGILLYEAGRKGVSEAGESLSDLVAEARSEIESQGRPIEEKTPGHPAGTPHEVA